MCHSYMFNRAEVYYTVEVFKGLKTINLSRDTKLSIHLYKQFVVDNYNASVSCQSKVSPSNELRKI